ncbi:hypothetical protein [Roseococcus sp. YIM B11640]|uniref:hypothetical protein n=1 Tax=Roseococcus sp. YIM B11640 TaxID=3133973 RepID=UPI003C7A1E11
MQGLSHMQVKPCPHVSLWRGGERHIDPGGDMLPAAVPERIVDGPGGFDGRNVREIEEDV